MEASVILIVSFFVLLALNLPIAVCMGLSTFLAILLSDITVPPVLMAQRVFATLDSFPFMAVPFFILSGTLMEHGGMSRRLIDLAKCIVGRLVGGLAYITIIASAFFGALTGSAAATVAAIGGIMIPSMKKEGYPHDFSAATAAAGGTFGVVFPPSVPMVTYAVIANVSVGSMFMGGFVPGFLLAISILITIHIMTRKMTIAPQEEKEVEKITLGKAFVRSTGALMMPVIILGGIYSGFSTPTEAAAIAVIYSLIMAIYGYREIKWKDMPNIFVIAGRTTAMIMIIVGMSGAFSWLLTNQRIPDLIANSILGLTTNFYMIIFIAVALMLIAGMVIETNALILMLAPIFLPIMAQIGYNPIAFGLVMVITTAVGKLIPPMALNVMVASSISGLSIEAIAKRCIPYLVGLIFVTLIVSFFPEILLFLPRLVGLPV